MGHALALWHLWGLRDLHGLQSPDGAQLPVQGSGCSQGTDATGYTRIVIGGRGPYVEFLPGHLIWDSLKIPNEEKHRLEHPWKEKVFYVEWRTKDQSNVKVYEQSKTVDYADYKVGLFYISPFDLFVEVEAVIGKLEKRKSKSVRE